jgi:hypothetical protein
MSAHGHPHAATPEPSAFGAPESLPQREMIARGLVFSLAAVLGGIALTVVIWRLGFIASITSFALAAGAVFLYVRGAGSVPRKGLAPLVLLILAGVVASFFAVIASDAWDAYDKFVVPGTQTRWDFLTDNVFRGEVISSYGKDMAMFGVFAVLGIFSIMRRLMSRPAA